MPPKQDWNSMISCIMVIVPTPKTVIEHTQTRETPICNKPGVDWLLAVRIHTFDWLIVLLGQSEYLVDSNCQEAVSIFLDRFIVKTNLHHLTNQITPKLCFAQLSHDVMNYL